MSASLAPSPIHRQPRLNGVEHILLAIGLGQEVDRTGPHGAHGHGHVAVRGHEYHRNVGAGVMERILQIEATRFRHPHIDDETRWRIWQFGLKEVVDGLVRFSA